jgi:hypothetical protein
MVRNFPKNCRSLISTTSEHSMKPEVHHRAHKTPPLDLMLSQTNVYSCFFKSCVNTGIPSITIYPRNTQTFTSHSHTHRMHVSFSTAWREWRVLPILSSLVWSQQSNTYYSSSCFSNPAYPIVSSSILHSIWMIYLIFRYIQSAFFVSITKKYNHSECFNFNISSMTQETRRYKILKWKLASILAS